MGKKKKETTIQQDLLSLMTLLENAQEDAEKFDDGVNAPGARVRKALMAVKKGSDALRKKIQAIKNDR